MTTGAPHEAGPRAGLPLLARPPRLWVASIRGIAFPAVFMAGCLCLIAFFAHIDVYNAHFFDRSYAAIYNAFRIAFGFYLFLLVYTTGKITLHLAGRDDTAIGGIGARIVWCFFAGAIVWQFLMLALGYLSLYYRPIAIAVSVPVILIASFEVGPLARGVRDSLAARLHGHAVHSKAPAYILLGCLVVAASALAIVKGLYPAGSHDYFTHYFYYYTTSLKNHGIWPNDVWYHYFYSKGEGLFFLGMLLTDPLAPSVVTYCFVVVAAIALFLFIDRMMPGTLWPWAAATCLLVVLIGAGGEEGFAEFPKEHEVNAAFVMCFIWLCDGMLRSTRAGALQLGLAASCAFAVAFTEQPTPILLGMVTSGIAAALLIRRQIRQSVQFVWLACASGLGLVCSLTLNILTTGIANDVLINALWTVTDLHKTEAVGWLFSVIRRSRDLSMLLGQHWGNVNFLLANVPSFLHLDFMKPWFGYAPGAALAAATALVLTIRHKRVPRSMQPPILIIGMIFLAFLCFASTLGGTAADSFSRYTSFMLPVDLAAGAMVWMLVADLSGFSWVRQVVASGLPPIATALILGHVWQVDKTTYRVALRDGFDFISGRSSIYDAYKVYDPGTGWPFREPWGAIYPGSLAVWKQLERGTRVWTFHIHAYCMLPDCRFESHGPFTMSPHMFDILFGPPDRARDILQSEGLNYFLVSRELEIHDLRPASGLFSPDRIGGYLGVKWTDGTSYLLTWLGPGVEPLSTEWLEGYRRQVGEARLVQKFPEQQYRDIYDRLRADPSWGRDLPLPWLQRSGSSG